MRGKMIKMYMVGILVSMCGLKAGEIKPTLMRILQNSSSDTLIDIIIHLKEKPDIYNFPKEAKVQKVIYLKEFARETQRNIMHYLTQHPAEVKDIKSFWIFNGIYCKASPRIIKELCKRENIEYIVEDAPAVFLLDVNPSFFSQDETMSIEWNIYKVNAPAFWEAGITGKDVIIGVLDTGVEQVDALAGKRIGWYDATPDHKPEPIDLVGHGTMVTGVICGGDGFGSFPNDIGMAPGAKFVAVRITADGSYVKLSWIHDAMQYVASLAEINKEPRVVNNSWGVKDEYALEFWDDIITWRNLNIIPVFAIGNDGPNPQSVDAPGNYPTVIGVGATDANDNIASFSSRGPAPNQLPWNNPQYWPRPDWNLIKPDISAPGVHIRSCSKDNPYYEIGSGTSFSAPHVTGFIALLLQINSNLDFYEVYNVLAQYADRPSQGAPYPNNNYGWGRLDGYPGLIFPNVNESNYVFGVGTKYYIKYGVKAEEGLVFSETWLSVNGGGSFPYLLRRFDYFFNPTFKFHQFEWIPEYSHITNHGRIKVISYTSSGGWIGYITNYDFKVIEFPDKWQKVLEIPYGATVNEIAIDPQRPWIMFAAVGDIGVGSNYGIYKSDDWGTTWTRIIPNPQNPEQGIFCIAIDPNNPNIIYAGSRRYVNEPQLFKSINGGITWTGINLGDGTSIIYDIEITSNGKIYACGTKQLPGNPQYIRIYKSIDDGSTWVLKINGFNSSPYKGGVPKIIKSAPSSPEILYVGLSHDNQSAPFHNTTIWRSTDGGENWSDISIYFHNEIRKKFPDVVSLAVDKNDPLTAYVGMNGSSIPNMGVKGMYRVKDKNWEFFDQGIDINKKISAVGITPDGNLVLQTYKQLLIILIILFL